MNGSALALDLRSHPLHLRRNALRQSRPRHRFNQGNGNDAVGGLSGLVVPAGHFSALWGADHPYDARPLCVVATTFAQVSMRAYNMHWALAFPCCLPSM